MNANASLLIWAILIPATAGVLCLFISDRRKGVKEILTVLTTGMGVVLAAFLFSLQEAKFYLEWLPYGMNIDFRLYHFSKFILLAASGFSFLVSLYSVAFMAGKYRLRFYYSYLLLTAACTYGAVLANNFVVLLFFWGALLITLYGLITIGGGESYLTAAKSFIIVGLSDLCLVLGIMIVAHRSYTLTMDAVRLSMVGTANLAFVLMMIGALAKAGAMPFHSWIPDAALDAPLPVMAFLPAALEKLLGIYLLSRICLDFFEIDGQMGFILLIIGAVTIVFAVAMALVQKNYKKLLSYHAISQVGYMVLGIGTGIPIGIAGGIFHMLNHSMYKCCLFLSGGSVEHATGTTDLTRLGGLMRRMPATFVCFAIAALSISGVPPFNGFFSKEMIFEASSRLNTPVFFMAAELGAILTFASFLKLGHSAFLGKRKEEFLQVRESSPAILLPMVVLALGCVLFGLYNELPLRYLVEPVLPMQHEHFWGPIHWERSITLISIGSLLVALTSHIYGVRRTGAGIRAADHIHHAPVLSTIYAMAERKAFDPYVLGMKLNGLGSAVFFRIDRMNNWIFDSLITGVMRFFSIQLRRAHTGLMSEYLSWCLAGGLLIFIFILWVR
jgi:formate hydrogenlyase subunit 3/multisubunit Na+/H+ antiporter MnhD subunit